MNPIEKSTTKLIELDPNTARLTVDLSALKTNFLLLNEMTGDARLAAVVKADGYGLGAARLAPPLVEAGCDLFFVARAHEGAALRDAGISQDIFILDGLAVAEPEQLHRYNLTPCLNRLAEIERWGAYAQAQGIKLSAAVHFDTGISRLAMPLAEFETMAGDPSCLNGIDVAFWMSHLACADAPSHPQNAKQLNRFKAALARLPAAKACLANSGGIFLGKDYHFDVCRTGIALFGCRPGKLKSERLSAVVLAEARVLQVRDIPAGTTVGYGATWEAKRPSRIATMGLGYADGYPRHLGGLADVGFKGQRAPIIGRISMDLLMADLTDLPPDLVSAGDWAEIMGETVRAEELAAMAGTIPYEMLTSLGRRYRRQYA